MRRIGVLIGRDENDPLAKTDVSVFTQALAGLGWADGRTESPLGNVSARARGSISAGPRSESASKEDIAALVILFFFVSAFPPPDRLRP